MEGESTALSTSHGSRRSTRAWVVVEEEVEEVWLRGVSAHCPVSSLQLHAKQKIPPKASC